MELSKDTYEYLTNFADDRTILNMLSVNKKFNDEQFFKRIMQRKYPFLIPLKGDGETMRGLFIRMSYYIAKIEEDFGIPYIAFKKYNPEKFYKIWKDDPNIYTKALEQAVKINDMHIVRLMLDKGVVKLDRALTFAVLGRYTDMIRLLLEKGADNYDFPLMAAASTPTDMRLVEFFLSKGATLNKGMWVAIRDNNLDLVNFFIDKGYTDYNRGLSTASERGYINIVQLFIDKGATNFTVSRRIANKNGHMDIVQLLDQYI
tara:strand:- start:987 stop:1766 length:780 start_codon:yes stop_codon:yes gene_type:complete